MAAATSITPITNLSVLCMDLVNCVGCASGVAHGAGFTKLRGVSKSMHGRRDIHVAAGAGRGDGLNRSDRTLRVDHRILTAGQSHLARVNMAHRAVLQIQGRARGAKRRVQRAGEVVVASPNPTIT